MKSNKKIKLDFVIDKLTNSILNTISGDSFTTEVSRVTIADLKQIKGNEKWNFDWGMELADDTRDVYKLTITNNSDIIQGLLSLSVRRDHIYMNLVESAPFNLGRNKLYEGVPGNLVPFACKVSFQQGFEGFVSFTSKTKLIEHYERTLGAVHFGNHLMVINTGSAKGLVEKYFKS